MIALKVTDHDAAVLIMQLIECGVLTVHEARELIIEED